MLALLIVMLMVLALDIAFDNIPPVKRMFTAEKPFLTQEYLEHELFLLLNRDQGLEWWLGFSE